MGTPWEIADQASRMLREVHQARTDIAELLNELARQRDQQAGIALWCSLGLHAFSGQDRQRTTFTVDSFDDDGQPIKEVAVACGQCGAKRRAALAPKPALEQQADPELYRQFLEWKNGMAPEPGQSAGM